MRIFCCDFAFNTMESFTLNRELLLTVMWIVDACEQRPEWRFCGFTDEPTGSVASELENAGLETAQAELFIGIVRVDFTQHVLVTLRIGDCMTIGTMDFENWLNDLQIKSQ